MLERTVRLRWRDLDAYGHVNNAVYLTYLEEVRDAWARQTLGDGFDFVIVRIAIDFRDELSLADEDVTVRCWGAGVGRSSIRTREQILKRGSRPAADSESVIVSHDPETRRARPLTDRQRALVQAAVDADRLSAAR